MKKTIAILTTILTSSLFINSRAHAESSYKVNCVVKNMLDNDKEILNRSFKIYRNVNASYLERFQPEGSVDQFSIQVLYLEDPDKFSVIIQDDCAQISASTSEIEPRRLNLNFGTLDASLSTVCTFQPIEKPKAE